MFTLAHEAYDRGLAAARDHRAILREDMDRALAEAARGGADPGVAQHPVGRHDARDAQRVVETLPPPRRPNATASRRHEIREDREHARADRYAFLGAHPQHHATVWRWRAAARRRAGPSAPHPAPATARHARVRRGMSGAAAQNPSGIFSRPPSAAMTLSTSFPASVATTRTWPMFRPVTAPRPRDRACRSAHRK